MKTRPIVVCFLLGWTSIGLSAAETGFIQITAPPGLQVFLDGVSQRTLLGLAT